MPDEALLLKADPAGDRKAKNAYPVRRDGVVRRQSQQNQNGDDQNRPAADEGAEGCRGDAGGEEQEVFGESVQMWWSFCA